MQIDHFISEEYIRVMTKCNNNYDNRQIGELDLP